MTENTSKRQRRQLTNWIVWIADLLAIWTSVLLLTDFFDQSVFVLFTRIVLILATVAYVPAAMYMARGDALIRTLSLDKVFMNAFKALVIHALVFMSLSAFLHFSYSMTFYAVFYAILLVVFPIINLICRKFIKIARSRGHNYSRVAIVGTNNTSRRLAESLRKDIGFGYKIVGFFDNECKEGFQGEYIGDLKVLDQYAREHKIDEIYFTLVGEKAGEMPEVVHIADNNMLEFYYVPKISHYVKGSFQLHTVGTMPVLSLRRNPLSVGWNRFLKRSFDLAFSSVVLLFSPLIFIPVAIGIKLSSPGPIFFRQERTGLKGNSFNCYKFRTMKVNADADKAQATLDDPRKTKLGDFLRKTSIDELPQFINVWLGDMSVVGPRPHMLKHTEDYTRLIDQYMVRHIVKPGITGWAQVNGYRGITDELWKMEKRVDCDVWYIENWTFTLDLKIIFRTVLNAVRGEKNAF